jgi:hypothetical protein
MGSPSMKGKMLLREVSSHWKPGGKKNQGSGVKLPEMLRSPFASCSAAELGSAEAAEIQPCCPQEHHSPEAQTARKAMNCSLTAADVNSRPPGHAQPSGLQSLGGHHQRLRRGTPNFPPHTMARTAAMWGAWPFLSPDSRLFPLASSAENRRAAAWSGAAAGIMA